MDIRFNLAVVFSGAVIILGLFAAIGLFFRKQNRLPNRLVAFFLLASSLWLIDNFMRVSGIYQQAPDNYFKPIYYSFAFGPLIYFYVRAITNGSFRFRIIHLLHFTPVLLQASLYLFLTFQDYSFKRWFWIEIHSPYTYRIEFDGSFISLAIYSFISIKILFSYQAWLRDSYSETSKSLLNWLKVILFLLILLTAQWFIEVIIRDFYQDFYAYNYSILILGILTLVLAYRAFHQADQGDINYIYASTDADRTLKMEFDQSILDQIEDRMKTKKDYLNPTLNLKTFASNCKLPQRVVSQYLNRQLSKSFHTYVNDYRIKEFKNHIKAGDHKQMTLEGLSYECGFNSKATFNRIFKNSTGQTPSQFVER